MSVRLVRTSGTDERPVIDLRLPTGREVHIEDFDSDAPESHLHLSWSINGRDHVSAYRFLRTLRPAFRDHVSIVNVSGGEQHPRLLRGIPLGVYASALSDVRVIRVDHVDEYVGEDDYSVTWGNWANDDPQYREIGVTVHDWGQVPEIVNAFKVDDVIQHLPDVKSILRNIAQTA